MKNAADLKADTKGQEKYFVMQNLEDISPAKSDKAKTCTQQGQTIYEGQVCQAILQSGLLLNFTTLLQTA